MSPLHQKRSGAYFTPDNVVQSLLCWAVRGKQDRLLDPACGDGRFVAGHHHSVGIEQDPISAAMAISRAPGALIHTGDFFSWAAETDERFDCAAGNPPFIRYQTFNGETRARAQRLCRMLGVDFSGLASSWAPFLAVTASLLRPGGRMAFVVPAEIGHAPYAAPLLDYLVSHFARVQIVAVREKLFPELSEDCWLLYAEGYSRQTSVIALSVLERFSFSLSPPKARVSVEVSDWATCWNKRLRPFLLPRDVRDFYRKLKGHDQTCRLGDIASVGIGYVSGANQFFHLRPSEAERLNIPKALLHPSVRNGRALPDGRLTKVSVMRWRSADESMLLLRLPKTIELPAPVLKYLNSLEGRAAREAYKCRTRKPWWSVPDVQVPDFFLTYLSGRNPNLVSNEARCTCTNSVHRVLVRKKDEIPRLVSSWKSPVVRLSCEIEGHPLGGGMLKLEPGEASQILLPSPRLVSRHNSSLIKAAVDTMRSWRHYAHAT